MMTQLKRLVSTGAAILLTIVAGAPATIVNIIAAPVDTSLFI